MFAFSLYGYKYTCIYFESTKNLMLTEMMLIEVNKDCMDNVCKRTKCDVHYESVQIQKEQM